MKVQVFSFLLAALAAVTARPNGAPGCRANGTVIAAGMGVSTLAELGFTVTASPSTYSPGTPVQITINSATQRSFKGLLIYLNANDKPLLRSGIFDIPQGFKPGACNPSPEFAFVNDGLASTVTHDSPADKRVPFTLRWTPGPTSVGELSIRTVIALGQTQWQVLTPVALPSGNGAGNGTAVGIPPMGGWKKCIRAGSSGAPLSAPAAQAAGQIAAQGSASSGY